MIMQTNPTQAAIDLCIALGIPDHHAPTIQTAFAEREARLVDHAEYLATLLTKAIGDITALLVIADKEDKIEYHTNEYVTAVNDADTTLAALKDRTQ